MFTTGRPALSALYVRTFRNMDHAASQMLLFKPALAARPLGRYSPVSSSCFGAGRLDIFLTWRASTAIRPERFCIHFAAEADEPFFALTPKRTGFDLALHRAVQDSLEGSYLGELDDVLSHSKAALRIGDAVVLTSALQAWIAGFLSWFDTVK